MNTSLKTLSVALAVSDVFVKPEHAVEHSRVGYVGVRDRARAFEVDREGSRGVYAALCSIAYDARPDQAVASGSNKERAKLISKALKASAVIVADKSLSPTAGKSISVIARAMALHGMDGILANVPDGETAPEFFGKSFVEQRDAAEKEPETAAACLSRLAKAWQPHAGSRVAPGSVDADQVRALAVACLGALGLTFESEGLSRVEYDSLPQVTRREIEEALS